MHGCEVSSGQKSPLMVPLVTPEPMVVMPLPLMVPPLQANDVDTVTVPVPPNVPLEKFNVAMLVASLKLAVPLERFSVPVLPVEAAAMLSVPPVTFKVPSVSMLFRLVVPDEDE